MTRPIAREEPAGEIWHRNEEALQIYVVNFVDRVHAWDWRTRQPTHWHDAPTRGNAWIL